MTTTLTISLIDADTFVAKVLPTDPVVGIHPDIAEAPRFMVKFLLNGDTIAYVFMSEPQLKSLKESIHV